MLVFYAVGYCLVPFEDGRHNVGVGVYVFGARVTCVGLRGFLLIIRLRLPRIAAVRLALILRRQAL